MRKFWLAVVISGISCACGVRDFENRRTTSGLGESAASGLRLVAGDVDAPAEKDIFGENLRIPYLNRANEAVLKAKATCAQDKCDVVVNTTKGPTRVLFFRNKSHKLNVQAATDCIKLDKGSPPDSMTVVEGESRAGTILDFSDTSLAACEGIAVNAKGGTIVVRNLTIRGGYVTRQEDANRRVLPVYHDENDWDKNGMKMRWNKAILARYAGSHIHVENASVDNFYYGVAAEEDATGFAYAVAVSDAGDAGFFAYNGGQMRVEGSVARNAVDISRKLGFGFVAETLPVFSKGSDKYCDDAVASACGLWPSDDKPADQVAHRQCSKPIIDVCAEAYSRKTPDNFKFCEEASKDSILPDYQDKWGCITTLSKQVPNDKRSYMRIIDSVAHDNFMGGFLANSGAVMVTSNTKAFGHLPHEQGRSELPPLHIRSGSREKPNVYPYDWVGAGFGYLARHGSKITAENAMSYYNSIGFQTFSDASMYAPGARAWSNADYGFHAVRKGRINAVNAMAFGPGQYYGFATDADDSMINISGTMTVMAPSPALPQGRTISPFCVWPAVPGPCPHYVTPAVQSIDFNLDLYKNTSAGGVGLFYQ